jgi:FkbM family methyltransferase
VKSIYHPRGFLNALFRGGARHLREWARNPSYRALHRFARILKNLPRGKNTHLAYAGRIIELVDGPSFLSAWDEIFVNRIYDIGECQKSRPVFVDAGANIGLAALYWKTRYKDFDYIGFEPDPDVAACCRRNLSSWGIEGQLIEAAVSHRDGEVGFISDRADGGHLAYVEKPGMKTVKSVRLTSYLPSRVDLLKIDVEGAEAEVLGEIESHLVSVNAIFVEWHCRHGETGLGRAIDLLESAGFDCHVQVAIGQERPFESKVAHGSYYQNLNLYGVRR